MAGKNHVEKSFRLFLDDSSQARNVTPSLIAGSAQIGGLVLDQVDMTGVSNTVRNYLAGHAESPISAKFHMDTTATTGAKTVLDDAGDGFVGTITGQWGQDGAAPTTGDPEWEGEYVYLGYNVASEGGRSVMNFNAQPSGATAPAWGTVA